MIRLHRVSKIYPPRFSALADVSLHMEAGELAFLTGPSGAGKTTLLRLLVGADPPSTGQVVVDGRNLARLGRRGVMLLRRRIGMVFQDSKLLPGMSVLENVAIAATATGETPRTARTKAFRWLRDLGLKDLIERHPPSLSSGEQQRVALARALMNDPMLLLADEPTGNLDEESAGKVVELMLAANRRGATVLVATHDTELLRNVPARMIALAKGRVVSGGDSEDGDRGASHAAEDAAAGGRSVLR